MAKVTIDSEVLDQALHLWQRAQMVRKLHEEFWSQSKEQRQEDRSDPPTGKLSQLREAEEELLFYITEQMS